MPSFGCRSFFEINEKSCVKIYVGIVGNTQKERWIIKSILLVLAENMYGVHLTQAFIMGIKSLAKLHSNRMASKILKKASNANPKLRIDPIFVQIMNELK